MKRNPLASIALAAVLLGTLSLHEAVAGPSGTADPAPAASRSRTRPSAGPQTRAESSRFKETMLFSEVMDFLVTLTERSDAIRLETFAVTVEGKELPLAILGDPVPESPLQAAASGRPVVLLLADIHAGEVEGKEASLMLARDILLGDLGHLIENQIVLVAPIYNADGNDRISRENRTNQVGPKGGVGVRHNALRLDLNRDWIKLESPEARGLMANVLSRWDPLVLVDLHTTNGSYHQEPLMYSWPLNPFTDRVLLTHARDRLLPTVAKAVLEKHGYESIPYGNFRNRLDPSEGWEKFGAEARYSNNYMGMRNRIGILDENYAYADYETRVRACYAFCQEILEYTKERGEELGKLTRAADARMLGSRASFALPVELELLPFPEEITIKSYVFERETDADGRERPVPTRTKHDYTIPFFGDYRAVRSVPVPFGYLLDPAHERVVATLHAHGIRVEELVRERELAVEVFSITGLETAERPFQGHHLTKVEGEWNPETRTFPAGTLFVGFQQPLGRLVAYLLEPENPDGLLAWNFFDRYLTAGQWRKGWGTYPVFRIASGEPRLPLRSLGPARRTGP